MVRCGRRNNVRNWYRVLLAIPLAHNSSGIPKTRRFVLISISRFLAPAILIAGCALLADGKSQTTSVAGSAAQASTASRESATTSHPGKQAPAAVERGKALFATNCSFCHGANAKGGESGPDLIRSLVVLDDENGDRIGPVVLNGRPQKGMPKFPYSNEQVSDLAAFLHHQIQATAAFRSYQVLDILVGDAAKGAAYFNGAGECNRCHSVSGDLAHIGSKYAPMDLQQRFLMPRGERGSPVQSQSDGSAVHARITLSSGETFEGHLVEIDDFRLTVIDAKGERRYFSRDSETPHIELIDPLREHAELLLKIKDSEMHNLTAYLVTLK